LKLHPKLFSVQQREIPNQFNHLKIFLAASPTSKTVDTCSRSTCFCAVDSSPHTKFRKSVLFVFTQWTMLLTVLFRITFAWGWNRSIIIQLERFFRWRRQSHTC